MPWMTVRKGLAEVVDQRREVEPYLAAEGVDCLASGLELEPGCIGCQVELPSEEGCMAKPSWEPCCS